MTFAIHPPTLELQLTLLRLLQRSGERWLELCACAAGERVAGLLHECVINLQPLDMAELPGAARESASRQVDDLLGDNRRLGAMAWQNQVEFWTDVQQAFQTWQASTCARA